VLIRKLELAPCYVGEYAGCRTTPLLCVRHPGLVKGLMLAWPSGGENPAKRVPRVMYQTYTRAALRSGMKGVVETPHFAESIRQNPANRERLLAMNATQFVRQMAYWQAFFNTTGDLPIAGCVLTDEQWASIKVPATVTGGCDPIHPTEAAERLHRLLPNSRIHEPVIPLDEFLTVFGVKEYPVVSDLQGKRIAPVWRDFIVQTEKGKP
jgi:2-hydroxy-6-oxonona-2,4-dienedioate hydrolase